MDETTRILVVDDDENIREALATNLEEEGYAVDTVETGRDAIAKTNTNVYNLALIDIRLPDTTGTKLLTKLKETTPKMIKIIITGFPSLQNAVEAVNKGADGYVIKPLDIAQTLSAIEEHLKKQQESRKFSEEKVAEFIKTRVKELSERNQPAA